MNQPIKFGTDGWRGIIADDFTVANVRRVSAGVVGYLKSTTPRNGKAHRVVLGHDCRFAGKLFVETTAEVLAEAGIEVIMAKSFVSTPMLSLACARLDTDFGVIITASHNPPGYSGFKLKAHFGGPAIPSTVAEVERHIPDSEVAKPAQSFAKALDSGIVSYFDFEGLYIDECQKAFDMEAVSEASKTVVYDAMFGAGQAVAKTLLPNAHFLHATDNPGFLGTAPEPIAKNLRILEKTLADNNQYQLGIATDGDADRIGLMDADGSFVDSHHIILLLIQYLVQHKGWGGKVVVSFSVSDRVKRLAAHYGLEVEVTKIGFKYICEIMTQEDVLVGGEESGGIAIKGYIPERDGLYIGLILTEFMAKTSKSLTELVHEVYAITGPFACARQDLHIDNEIKNYVVETAKDQGFSEFGGNKVVMQEDIDGFKFHFEGGSWLMVRASGTEPVLRVYSEASTQEEAEAIIEAGKATFFAKAGQPA